MRILELLRQAIRRRRPRCRGLEPLPGNGHDRLVALATDRIDDDELREETLDHVVECEECAGKLRVILLLRGMMIKDPELTTTMHEQLEGARARREIS